MEKCKPGYGSEAPSKGKTFTTPKTDKGNTNANGQRNGRVNTSGMGGCCGDKVK